MKGSLRSALSLLLVCAASCAGASGRASAPEDAGGSDAADEDSDDTGHDAGPPGPRQRDEPNVPSTGCAVIVCPADLVCRNGACVPFGGRGGVSGQGGRGGVAGNP